MAHLYFYSPYKTYRIVQLTVCLIGVEWIYRNCMKRSSFNAGDARLIYGENFLEKNIFVFPFSDYSDLALTSSLLALSKYCGVDGIGKNVA